LCIIDQVTYRVVTVISVIGLIGEVAGVVAVGYRVIDALQAVIG